MCSRHSLPVELISHIGLYCCRADLKSLVLASRSYHRNLAPILYANVLLDSLESILAFHCTICTRRTSFGAYPKVIHVNLPSLDNDPDLLAPLIHEVLVSAPKLLELSLSLPSNIIARILSGSPYQFLLVRLSIPAARDEAFMSFLRHQPQIKTLHLQNHIARRPNRYRLMARFLPEALVIPELDPTTLPNLQMISTHQRNLPHLIPGRPIANIQVISPLSSASLREFGVLLVKSSASLTHLNISMEMNDFCVCEEDDISLLNIEHGLTSLTDLTICLLVRLNGRRKPNSVLKWLKVSVSTLRMLL